MSDDEHDRDDRGDRADCDQDPLPHGGATL